MKYHLLSPKFFENLREEKQNFMNLHDYGIDPYVIGASDLQETLNFDIKSRLVGRLRRSLLVTLIAASLLLLWLMYFGINGTQTSLALFGVVFVSGFMTTTRIGYGIRMWFRHRYLNRSKIAPTGKENRKKYLVIEMNVNNIANYTESDLANGLLQCLSDFTGMYFFQKFARSCTSRKDFNDTRFLRRTTANIPVSLIDLIEVIFLGSGVLVAYKHSELLPTLPFIYWITQIFTRIAKLPVRNDLENALKVLYMICWWHYLDKNELLRFVLLISPNADVPQCVDAMNLKAKDFDFPFRFISLVYKRNYVTTSERPRRSIRRSASPAA